MRTLYLLRHAKSSWKDDSLADFDRPLKNRGREAAVAVGELLAKEKLKHALFVTSPALRTRQTSEIVIDSASLDVEPIFDKRIYEADLEKLLEVIRQLDDKHKVAILVGHNPGMEYLLNFLTGAQEQMPTAALAKISIDSNWNGIERGKNRLEWVVRPRDL